MLLISKPAIPRRSVVDWLAAPLHRLSKTQMEKTGAQPCFLTFGGFPAKCRMHPIYIANLTPYEK